MFQTQQQRTNDIIQMYLHYFPVEMIAEKYDVSRARIYQILKDNNINVELATTKEDRKQISRRRKIIRGMKYKLVPMHFWNLPDELKYSVLDFISNPDIFSAYMPGVKDIRYRRDDELQYEYMIVDERLEEAKREEFRKIFHDALQDGYGKDIPIYFERNLSSIKEEKHFRLRPICIYDRDRFRQPWEE